MPPLSQHPAQAPSGGITSLPSFPDPEAYYSNDDIEILYSVVSRAQEILNDLPEGERLATNALFSAYDEVLPLYSIDPEEDHHISRLIFRIGGERGVGSLLDRCRDVLLRMGIELELDSDSHTVSSTTPSDHLNSVIDTARIGTVDADILTHLDTLSEPQDKQIANQAPLRDPVALSTPDVSPNRAAHTLNPSNVLARRGQQPLSPGNRGAPHEMPSQHHPAWDTRKDDLESLGELGRVLRVTDTLSLPQGHMRGIQRPLPHGETPISPQLPGNPSFEWLLSQVPEREPLHLVPGRQPPMHQGAGSPMNQSHGQDLEVYRTRSNQLQVQFDDLHLETRHQRLERRASRAWVLLQLTRAISHWTVFTDEKIERAAIARRHILRVRYFSSWVSDAVENKRSQRQKTLQKHAIVWTSLMHATSTTSQGQEKAYQQELLRRILRKWSTVSTSNVAGVPRSIVQRMTNLGIHHWQRQCLEKRNLDHEANTVQRLRTISRLQLAQSQDAGRYAQAAIRFQRCLCIFEILRLWTLVVRGRQLQDDLRARRLHALLRHWHDLPNNQVEQSSARPSSQGINFGYWQGPETVAKHFHHQLAVTEILKSWRHASAGSNTARLNASAHSAQRQTCQVLLIWHAGVHFSAELTQWAHRARDYLGYTATIRTWKQAVPRWPSSVQKAYVRCRWRHKALIARKKLSQWRTAVRNLDVIVHTSRPKELQVASDRLGHILGAWQQECRLQAALEMPAYLHDVWLNEWVVSLEGLGLVEHEASNAWAHTLKSKIWSKWRSVSVQLHSQLYIVTDVTEKNTRKSVRRILVYWKRGGEDLHASRPSSFVGSSYGISRGSRAQDSLLWSKTRSGQTAASSLLGSRVWPGDGDEDDMEQPTSEADEMQDVINTPTRRIGFETSLARLPTTTPLAPLSTPFERELRGRYGESTRTIQANQSGRLSIRGTPRLSAIEARRIAEQRRRRRPV